MSNATIDQQATGVQPMGSPKSSKPGSDECCGKMQCCRAAMACKQAVRLCDDVDAIRQNRKRAGFAATPCLARYRLLGRAMRPWYARALASGPRGFSPHNNAIGAIWVHATPVRSCHTRSALRTARSPAL